MKVSVCIASRGRPDLCRQTVAKLLAGIVLPDTRIVVALDNDDPERDSYGLSGCAVSVADREDSLGAKWNRAYRHADGDVAVLWPDDTVMLDKGWDEALANAAGTLPDQCGAVFFGDIPGVLQPGIAVTRKFADAMGFFAQPYTPFWWVDTWLLTQATMSGRAAQADVRVSLLTDLKGTSRGVRDILFWANFYHRLNPTRVKVAEQIINEGSESSAQKAVRIAELPQWIDYWARSGSILRDPAEAARLEAYYSFDAPADDRYARLKAKAEDILAELPA